MHPRSTCSHASPGSTPATIICALNVLPNDSHVGGCKGCRSNTNSVAVPDSPDADLQSAITAPPELLGDKIAVLAEKWGADKLAAAYERMTGLPCGCAGRRELLNRLDGWMRGLGSRKRAN